MSAFARVFCMIRGSRTPQNWEGAVLLSRNRANQLSAKIFLSRTFLTHNSKNLKPSRFLATKLKKSTNKKCDNSPHCNTPCIFWLRSRDVRGIVEESYKKQSA